MADLLVTGTSNTDTTVLSTPYVPEYLWSSSAKIQAYLSNRSVLQIGDASNEYPTEDAMIIENACVRDIVTYLDGFYEIDVDFYDPHLIDLASKLTASTIGASEMGASIGNDNTEWSIRYKNEVWADLSRIATRARYSTLTARTLTLTERWLYSMNREQQVIRTL